VSLAGQRRFLTPGAATSIAAGTKYFAVATASGQIFYFDASTDAMLGTIDFSSSQLAMSTNGTVLAAALIVSQGPFAGGITDIWCSSTDPACGAVSAAAATGSHVIFALGTLVLAQPY
jgi:hypothetical protein